MASRRLAAEARDATPTASARFAAHAHDGLLLSLAYVRWLPHMQGCHSSPAADAFFAAGYYIFAFFQGLHACLLPSYVTMMRMITPPGIYAAWVQADAKWPRATILRATLHELLLAACAPRSAESF